MAGVVSSITKTDFLSIPKAYPQATLRPKLSTLSFTSLSTYSKGRIQASSEEGRQVDAVAQNLKEGLEETKNRVQSINESIKDEAQGIIESTKEGASELADKGKEDADGAADTSASIQDKIIDNAAENKEKTDDALKSGFDKLKEIGETVAESAKDTAEKIVGTVEK